jgi:hypothetical protein
VAGSCERGYEPSSSGATELLVREASGYEIRDFQGRGKVRCLLRRGVV